MSLRTAVLVPCLLFAAFAGCGDDAQTNALVADAGVSDTPTPDDTPVAPDDTAAPVDADEGYPAGPYGTSVGQVLGDMRFEGFVNPTAEGVASEQPYGPTSMAALRGQRRGYAVVFIAEFL